MTRRAWIAILGYGAFAATLLACLWLASLAPLRLSWGRELAGAAIAIVALVLGLRLAHRPAAVPSTTPSTASPQTTSDASPLPVAAAPVGAPELSLREREVLQLLADGLSNKELARALSVSENTIKTHLANLYGKLGVGRRTEALAAARRWQLLGPG
jgi:ATP/maltotriose-dependent transcriptional regulator MalT